MGAAQRSIADGCGWVVDIGLEKSFDPVNHDRLMGRIMQRETDKTLIRLIRSSLTAGVMEDGLVSPTAGQPHGRRRAARRPAFAPVVESGVGRVGQGA